MLQNGPPACLVCIDYSSKDSVSLIHNGAVYSDVNSPRCKSPTGMSRLIPECGCLQSPRSQIQRTRSESIERLFGSRSLSLDLHNHNTKLLIHMWNI